MTRGFDFSKALAREIASAKVKASSPRLVFLSAQPTGDVDSSSSEGRCQIQNHYLWIDELAERLHKDGIGFIIIEDRADPNRDAVEELD